MMKTVCDSFIWHCSSIWSHQWTRNHNSNLPKNIICCSCLLRLRSMCLSCLITGNWCFGVGRGEGGGLKMCIFKNHMWYLSALIKGVLTSNLHSWKGCHKFKTFSWILLHACNLWIYDLELVRLLSSCGSTKGVWGT